jgi:hypothetical protein
MEVLGGEELHFGDSCHRASVLLPQVHRNWEAPQSYDFVMFSQPMMLIQNQTKLCTVVRLLAGGFRKQIVFFFRNAEIFTRKLFSIYIFLI